MSKAKILKDMISSGRTLVMPDAYDPLSAMIIEQMGFSAVQCSGYSIAIAEGLAEPDLDFERNLAVTAEIVKAVSVPVMADGEDGFDDIVLTIKAYMKAGVAGINIEDQVIAASSGSAIKKVIDREAAVAKIREARKTAVSEGTPDLLINARTDALLAAESRSAGLKESIVRCNMFLAAGADLAFVTNVASIEEVKTLVKDVSGPVSIAAGLPYNINNFSIKELQDCGVARVSLPSIAIQTSIAALARTLKMIKETGEFTELGNNGLLCRKEDLATLANKKSQH